jgi:hypothetical protein
MIALIPLTLAGNGGATPEGLLELRHVALLQHVICAGYTFIDLKQHEDGRLSSAAELVRSLMAGSRVGLGMDMWPWSEDPTLSYSPAIPYVTLSFTWASVGYCNTSLGKVLTTIGCHHFVVSQSIFLMRLRTGAP